jgi:predicted ester cyclase
MSLEENKTIVRKFIDAYNQHDLSSIEDFVAPAFVDHTHKSGREGLKQLFNMAFNAFPDMHETIEDIIAEGDKVWIRVTFSATHTGEWMGIPPTGKKVTSEMVDIYRIVNGKHVEGRFITDSLEFLKQLGVIEYTEQGKQLFPENVM